jgi:peptidoglycan/LPS O-acetylase OafA/YrhL
LEIATGFFWFAPPIRRRQAGACVFRMPRQRPRRQDDRLTSQRHFAHFRSASSIVVVEVKRLGGLFFVVVIKCNLFIVRFSGATLRFIALSMICVARIRCLDGLRGIAAVAVMEFHFSIFFLPQANLLKVPLLGRAYLSVDLFFLLSGFVMAHVYGKALASDWRAYWTRFAVARFARLYPVFAATTLVLVVAAILTRMPIRFVSLSGDTLALQPFLLQQWASGLSWNYPSWSISTEAEAYVYFVFFAGYLITGKNSRIIATCCVVCIIALSVSNEGSLNCFVGIRALLRTLAEFSLGVLLYRVKAGNTGPPRNWIGVIAVILFGCGLVTKLDFPIIGAFACLIYFCAIAPNTLPVRLLDSRPLIALGNWSYSIYLWHAPTHYIVMAAFYAFGDPVSNLSLWNARLLVLATTLAVMGVSAVHYRYFETPIRRLILRLNRIGQPGSSPPLALS